MKDVLTDKYSLLFGNCLERMKEIPDGFGKRIHLGVFDNEEDAFQAYKVGKEAVAKRLAEFYSGLVDERVVKALLNYTVSKDD